MPSSAAVRNTLPSPGFDNSVQSPQQNAPREVIARHPGAEGHRKKSRPSRSDVATTVAVCLACIGTASPVLGADLSDPLDTAALHAAGPADSRDRALRSPCQPAEDRKPLTLTDVVDRALCNNPQTREAWANARYQAAQVGIARSAYLPSISASATRSRNESSGFNSVTRTTTYISYDQTSAGLSFNFLL